MASSTSIHPRREHPVGTRKECRAAGARDPRRGNDDTQWQMQRFSAKMPRSASWGQKATLTCVKESHAHTAPGETPLMPGVFFLLYFTSQHEVGVVCSSLSTFISHWQKCKGLSQSGLPPLLPLPVPPPYALPSLQQPAPTPRTQFVVRSTFPHPVEEGPDAPFSIRGSANWNPSQPIRHEVNIPLSKELSRIDSWLGSMLLKRLRKSFFLLSSVWSVMKKFK